MKKKILLILVALLAMWKSAFAYSFSAVAPSGQTLYYNISGGSAVVTCPGSHSAYSGFTKPTGNLVIPNSVTNGGTTYAVTSIGNHAFNGCTGLTSVTIPDEVTNIGENSFYNCSSLASITIPNGVTSIGNQAFWGCSSLVSVMFNATHCSSVGNSFSNAAFRYCSNLTNYTFGDSVTIIPAYLCGGNSSLTSVTIPNSVISIGAAAFASCTGLTSVAIPNLVDSIANSAFSDCTGLTSITISDGLSSIGDFAFYNCTSLNSVTIPNSVTSIGRQAFYQCGLDSLIVGSALVTIGIEAFLGDTLSYLSYNCPANVLNKIYKYRLATVIIGDSVTSIGSSAFSGCTSLTSVTIGNGITSVGANAFYNCIGLTSVSIPDLVTSIGQYAFYGCSSLTSVSLGNSITSIGDQAFYNCNALNSVTIPNSVTYIGFCTFENCSGLTAVTIGNSVTNINSRAFKNCSGLTSVTIPNSVATIGYDAFQGCASLTTVVYNADSCTQAGELNYNGGIDPAFGHYSNITTFTFGENVKVIPNYLCYGLSGLTSVTIPDSVTWIGFKAFYNCSNLDSVILLPITAPLLAYNDVFQNNSVTRKFYIPCGSYNSYSNVIGYWTSFLQEPDPAYTIAVSVNNTSYGSATNTPVTCAEQTIISAIANNHYHFDHWSNGSTANPDTIILTSNLAVTAHFVPDQYTVTGVSSDTAKGSVSGSATVDYLSTVTLTATTNDGYHFVQWQDGNTQNPRTIVATMDRLFTATFNYNQYAIILNVDSNIHGSVAGGGSYNYLSEQTIAATANYGYHFTAWSDGDTNNPRTITLTQDTSFTALFGKNIYTITVNSGDTAKGTVTGSTSTEYLDSITITANPNYGHHFTAWNDGNTDNPRIIVATRDSLFTATFDYNQYTITLNVDTSIHGSVVGDGSYNYLSEQTITATANYGYHFTAWSDGDTNNPRTITLTQDTIFTAQFAKNTYTITAISADTIRGSVIGSTSIEYLDSVTIMANPNYGYHFTAWNDGNTDNPRIIVATRDSVFTASFGYNQYTITLNVDTNIHGAVAGGGSYNYLSEHPITATSNYGYHFTAWSDGDTNNPRTITLTQDTAFTALFAKNQYTLTLQSNDVAHGSVIGGGMFDYLDTVAIEATAVEHYHFVLWNDGNTDNPRQYVLIGNDTLIAFFAIDTHHVSVESCNIAFGSVTGGGDYEYGTPATVTATAYSGYQFISWSNGDTHNPYTFAVLQDTTLVAIFEAETQGIDDVVANAVNVYTLGGQIVVETNLKDEISIYDIVGRKVDGGRKTHFDVPVSGVYLVKIGTLSTQKVVVLK